LQEANTEALIIRFRQAGKITPATEPFARALLKAKPLAGSDIQPSETVKFMIDKDGTPTELIAHFADAFVAYLEASPRLFSMSEILQAQAESEDTFTPAQREWAKKNLKLSDEDMAKFGKTEVH
jgi:hypothetical protein